MSGAYVYCLIGAIIISCASLTAAISESPSFKQTSRNSYTAEDEEYTSFRFAYLTFPDAEAYKSTLTCAHRECVDTHYSNDYEGNDDYDDDKDYAFDKDCKHIDSTAEQTAAGSDEEAAVRTCNDRSWGRKKARELQPVFQVYLKYPHLQEKQNKEESEEEEEEESEEHCVEKTDGFDKQQQQQQRMELAPYVRIFDAITETDIAAIGKLMNCVQDHLSHSHYEVREFEGNGVYGGGNIVRYITGFIDMVLPELTAHLVSIALQAIRSNKEMQQVRGEVYRSTATSTELLFSPSIEEGPRRRRGGAGAEGAEGKGADTNHGDSDVEDEAYDENGHQKYVLWSPSLHIRTVEVLEYSQGGELVWHIDTDSNYTMILLLSDYDDYAGGELRLAWNNTHFLGYEPYILESDRGSGVIFDSSTFHAVAPITDGQRYVLVVEFWYVSESVIGHLRPAAEWQKGDTCYNHNFKRDKHNYNVAVAAAAVAAADSLQSTEAAVE